MYAHLWNNVKLLTHFVSKPLELECFLINMTMLTTRRFDMKFIMEQKLSQLEYNRASDNVVNYERLVFHVCKVVSDSKPFDEKDYDERKY